ncbi:Conserved phage C-terminus (Phg_2220_C) [Sebaldella termitidis]|uniref:Phage conserved hypothetical protein C-terminal domain-containing protein n=1 Tax=Sebaldella termitidis (strain ATCC 33386 / NCTC 11300) TaxID=526218 RepID=D1AR14_SEBTE|nr:conserved phage C-terminal domain-containing protein [Sebaldella termitidis]ACZ07702.1 hypothetical protein Sterm_0830 [Sebaldella termitidis ATCC 33386]SUI22998.1 Conserved phage C-terminus (Phg_2220_C) [Sebaldella termitidis]
MKETLNSYFSQRKAMEFELMREDLDFLEWFIFWKDTGGMSSESIIHAEDKYYWISYSKILQDLPFIFRSESTVKRSLNRLIEKKIIKKYLGSKNGARATYFAIGENYIALLKADTRIKDEIPAAKEEKKRPAKFEKEHIEIIDHLNTVTKSAFKSDTVASKQLMNKLLESGFTVEDIKLVIEFKAKEWEGTDREQYLRPKTLFKMDYFPGYLKMARKGACNGSGNFERDEGSGFNRFN